jgi:hypothetical protein
VVAHFRENTHIQQHKSGMLQQVLQGFGTIYIEGHRRVLEIAAGIVNTLLFSYGFYIDFSFHLVFTLTFLTRFCGCVFGVFRLFHS